MQAERLLKCPGMNAQLTQCQASPMPSTLVSSNRWSISRHLLAKRTYGHFWIHELGSRAAVIIH